METLTDLGRLIKGSGDSMNSPGNSIPLGSPGVPKIMELDSSQIPNVKCRIKMKRVKFLKTADKNLFKIRVNYFQFHLL